MIMRIIRQISECLLIVPMSLLQMQETCRINSEGSSLPKAIYYPSSFLWPLFDCRMTKHNADPHGKMIAEIANADTGQNETAKQR